jgi:pimeloyl-ACP methyl ester carboxylesterase
MMTPMETYRASDGAELAFRDEGPRGVGLPLLFVHGWQADGSVWGPIASRLRERHRVITVDLRGTGASSAAPGPYVIDKFSNDLTELIPALDLDPVVVVGHSMGGAIAQRFAIDNPEAVEALVLIAPVPASGIPFSPKVLEFLRSTAGNAGQAAEWFKQLTVTEPAPEIGKLLREAAAGISTEAKLESFESWQGAAFADEAATIETPTLILAPSHDRPMTPELSREKVADVIAGSQFEVLSETGHYAPVERPELIAKRIEAFLDEL